MDSFDSFDGCHGCREYTGRVHPELPGAGHANAGAFYGDQRNATWATGWTYSKQQSMAKYAAESHGKLDGWVHSKVAMHPDAHLHTLSPHDTPIFGSGRTDFERQYFQTRATGTTEAALGRRLNREKDPGNLAEVFGDAYNPPDYRDYARTMRDRLRRAQKPPEEVATTLNGTLVRPAAGYIKPDLSQTAGVLMTGVGAYFTLGAFGLM